MGLKPRKSPAEGEFLFELDEQPLEATAAQRMREAWSARSENAVGGAVQPIHGAV
jgi:hypothetical protein